MATIKERGAAKMTIELSAGVITVMHGEGGTILARWTANSGDWTKIWQTISELQAKGNL